MDAFTQPFRFSALFDRFVAVSLRLPGVVILELWCRIFWGNNDDSTTLQERLHDKVQTWMEVFELSHMIKARNMDVVMEQVLTYSVLALGATFLLLPAKKLISVYLHAISVLLVGAGYYLSYRYVQTEQESGVAEIMLDDFAKLERHGFHFLSQVMLAVVVSCLLNFRGSLMRASLIAFSLPIVARLCGVPLEKLHVVHNFSSCFTMILICFYALNVVPHLLSMLRQFELRMKMSLREQGFVHTMYDFWSRLELPPLLALFWVVLCSTEVYVMFKGGAHHLILDENSYRHTGTTSWYIRCLLVFANCCKTPLSLLAFCSAIAYFSWLTLLSTKLLLNSDGDEANAAASLEVFNSGHAEAFTLLLLSVQTELIDRPPLERALLILIILFIVFSSLLQSIFDIVEPILLRISAAHLTDVWRHVKALAVCAALFTLPILMSTSIATLLPVDFWLMIIISSCVLTSVQTLGALAIYVLFFWDGWGRGVPWERLDDYIFVCRAITRVLEFLVAVFVVAYGVFESVFGEWSWINSSILLIHCYFNIWQRLQAGWKTLLRRDAAKKLDMLPKASKTQLNALQDVCAICYQELKEARMTPCNHFFHGSCLKKWLYVQQSCPMCHWDLSFKRSPSEGQRDRDRSAEEEGYSSDEYEMAEGDVPQGQ